MAPASSRRVLMGLAAGALGTLALLAGPARAQELCGRPAEGPQALLDRLTNVEKRKVDFRDKSYVVITDKAKETIWTFTVAGHPAYPSVVCRRPVHEGAEVKLEMDVQCNAAEAQCDRLVQSFQELNARMLEELKKQQPK